MIVTPRKVAPQISIIRMNIFYNTPKGRQLVNHLRAAVESMYNSRPRQFPARRLMQSMRERFIRIYHHGTKDTTKKPTGAMLVRYAGKNKEAVIGYVLDLVKSDAYHFLTREKPWGTEMLEGIGFVGNVRNGRLALKINPKKTGNPSRQDTRYKRSMRDLRQGLVQFVFTPHQRRLEGRK